MIKSNYQQIVRTDSGFVYRGFEVELHQIEYYTDLMIKYGWSLIDFSETTHWLFWRRKKIYLVFMLDMNTLMQ